MTIPLIGAVHDWYCPNCGKRDQTREVRPHSRFHTCPKLRGLAAPMLPAGTAAKVELREREDYVNGEKVQLDPERKRPVMSVVTTRDDGQDVAVFAPTATGRSD
jgi:predicted RNA-binding Zn-ribbon protein involved in translation (DUF1610 family)